MLILLTLSQCMIIECCILIYKSLSNIDSYVGSLETFASTLYFVSNKDRVIIGCFLNDHDICVLTILNTKFVVECICFISQMQSKSIYPIR